MHTDSKSLQVCRNVSLPTEQRWNCSFDELVEWFSQNRIIDGDLIWFPGINEWKKAAEAAEIIAKLKTLRFSPKATVTAEARARTSDTIIDTASDRKITGDFAGTGAKVNASASELLSKDEAKVSDPAPSSSLRGGEGQDDPKIDRSESALKAPARIKGKIQRARGRDGGVVQGEDGRAYRFRLRDVTDDCSTCILEGSEVDFQPSETSKDLEAKFVRVLKFRPMTDEDRQPEGKWLRDWAQLSLNLPHVHDGKRYINVFEALAKVALYETWKIGKGVNDRKLPLLQQYLYATFKRLASPTQKKIKIKHIEGKYWAVFNTGLVDELYRPIYLLFQEHDRYPWRFEAISVPPNGSGGRALIRLFDLHELPAAATYFENGSEIIMMLKNPDQVIPYRDEHLIDDAIRHDRYPSEFLQRYKPDDLEWEDYTKHPPLPKTKDEWLLGQSKRGKYLRQYAEKLREDVEALNAFKTALDAAIRMAQRRAFWNYKTAIPCYYPIADQVQLLLPLCLDSKSADTVSVALIVSRYPSGAYEGMTVYPLEWAYRYARVVCRPDSDWLEPEKIAPHGAVEADDASVPEDDD